MGDCASKAGGAGGLPKAPKQVTAIAPEPRLVARACGLDLYYLNRFEDYQGLEERYLRFRTEALEKGKTEDEAHEAAMGDHYTGLRAERLAFHIDQKLGLYDKASDAQKVMLEEAGNPEAEMDEMKRSLFHQAKHEACKAAVDKLCMEVLVEVLRKRAKGELTFEVGDESDDKPSEAP